VGAFFLKKFETMPKIKIDNIEYEVETFSPEARSRLDMLVATDNRLKELQRDVAIVQTARMAYAAALKEVLPVQSLPAALDVDGVFKFS
jgi:hypothetical protein